MIYYVAWVGWEQLTLTALLAVNSSRRKYESSGGGHTGHGSGNMTGDGDGAGKVEKGDTPSL